MLLLIFHFYQDVVIGFSINWFSVKLSKLHGVVSVFIYHTQFRMSIVFLSELFFIVVITAVCKKASLSKASPLIITGNNAFKPIFFLSLLDASV